MPWVMLQYLQVCRIPEAAYRTAGDSIQKEVSVSSPQACVWVVTWEKQRCCLNAAVEEKGGSAGLPVGRLGEVGLCLLEEYQT